MSSNETYFSLKAHPYTFYATIKKFKDHDMIHVGARTRCVTVRYDHKIHSFTLLVAQYDEHCTLDGCMDKGVGTIRMMKVAFTFLRRQYPRAKSTICFEDKSTIECANKRRLSLSYFYLAIHGKTWYEEKFGAQPILKFSDTYKEEKKRLFQYIDSKPPYSDIMRFASLPLREYLQPIYKLNTHVRTFILAINDEYDCAMFLDWLPQMIAMCMPFIVTYTWEINLDANQTDFVVSQLSERPSEVIFGGNYNNRG
jgi:hypothetical protein